MSDQLDPKAIDQVTRNLDTFALAIGRNMIEKSVSMLEDMHFQATGLPLTDELLGEHLLAWCEAAAMPDANLFAGLDFKVKH